MKLKKRRGRIPHMQLSEYIENMSDSKQSCVSQKTR